MTSKSDLQLTELFPQFDKLQKDCGDPTLASIYGAGRIESPSTMFIFMNPTGRNVASTSEWNGIRAPWIGTKKVWRLLASLDLITSKQLAQIGNLRPTEWDEQFAYSIYSTVARRQAYITNFAKCTLPDARSLSNTVFKKYRKLLLQEIKLIKPQKIVSFGNQVSSLLLEKQLSVSNYLADEVELLSIDDLAYKIYPTYYPVGQGQRNMPLAKRRLRKIIKI